MWLYTTQYVHKPDLKSSKKFSVYRRPNSHEAHILWGQQINFFFVIIAFETLSMDHFSRKKYKLSLVSMSFKMAHGSANTIHGLQNLG